MYGLLFFLPIHYRVIKGHSATVTGLLLLSQTLLLAPCGAMVVALVEKLDCQVQRVIALGWLCTSCGFGLLTTLDAEKSTAAEVLLNLLSAFGIGVLLPALAMSARDSSDSVPPRRPHQTTKVLVYMRYLGSATGLVVLGLAFQRIMQHNLSSSLSHQEAKALVRHATTLVYSISSMPRSERKVVLTQATQGALRTIWAVLAIASGVMFLLSCAKLLVNANWGRAKKPSPPMMSLGHASDLPDHSGEASLSDGDAAIRDVEKHVNAHEKEIEVGLKL